MTTLPATMIPQLSAAQLHELLPWESLAAALAQAFRRPPVVPVRHTHALGDAEHLLMMPAWNAEVIGTKLVTVLPEAVRHGGRTVEATYLLLDRLTGAPRAVMDGEALTVRRTAATSALAARLLARPDAHTLLMVGTGRLAPWMVRAHVALLPAITRVLVWGRRPSAAVAMAAALRDEDIPAEPVGELADAIHSADVISCATTSTEPIVRGAWLREGTHVDLVGAFTPAMREVDEVAVMRAAVVVDDRAGALAEAGDLLQPLAAGVIDRDHIRATLTDLLHGTSRVRTHASDITLFKSVGHALEDLAAATLALSSLTPDPIGIA